MADFYLCERLGETRVAVVEAGALVEMHLARIGDGLPAGSRVSARLSRKLGGRGVAILPSGEEAIIEPWPAGISEGAAIDVQIQRAAWREPGRPRLAKARLASARLARARPAWDAVPILSVQERLTAAGHALCPGWPDSLAAQWDDGWEAALLGRVLLPTGTLGFTPTPALVAVDVDGTGATLALDAARAAARTIRLWGLGGAIVIDFPALADKAARLALAAAFDAAMGDAPFERTAVNGFGLMQIVCPRPGPSILERARLEPHANAGQELLAAALAETRPGAITLVARPSVAAWLASHPALLADLARKTGRAVDVRADPALGSNAGSGHVETR